MVWQQGSGFLTLTYGGVLGVLCFIFLFLQKVPLLDPVAGSPEDRVHYFGSNQRALRPHVFVRMLIGHGSFRWVLQYLHFGIVSPVTWLVVTFCRA